MFFAYYVADFSRTWDFCFAYHDRHTTPEHLSLSIDAVSLAFLSHQVSSSTAKEMSRQKYVEALRKLSKALRDPSAAAATSTLEGALLLDLYEKFVKPASQTLADPQYAHVEGALALVKLRGVESFPKGRELRSLLGLSMNASICALSAGRPIPPEVIQIRAYAAQFVDTTDPKWRLSSATIQIPGLADDFRKASMTPEEQITKSAELDAELEAISLSAGPAWSYKRNFASTHDPRMNVPDGFFPLYDVYPNRTITQMWNVLRLTRILICESILDLCSSTATEENASHAQRAERAIVQMVREICASCPQMTNCEFAARHKLPAGENPGKTHSHTMSHVLDVYILIFALYVVAWARHCPDEARTWAVGQLEVIAGHFGVKEAGIVLELLRNREHFEGRDSWYVSSSWAW